MKAYKYDELSKRAKMNAISKYAGEAFNECSKVGVNIKDTDEIFEGWLFTEHGERIA